MQKDEIIPRVMRGAISELRAAVWLMEDGYCVYRSASPDAPFDLMAYRDGECLRVEVKTSSINRGPRGTWGIHPTFSMPINDEWDLLLVVMHGSGQVFAFTPDMSRAQIVSHIREALEADESHAA